MPTSVPLALTAGEKGASAGADIAEYRRNKIAVAEAFAKGLGGEAYVLDVTDGFPLWEKAIDHHWFAVHSTSFPYKEYYSHLKRLRGIQGRKGYCECFMIPKEQYKLVQTMEEI